MTSVVQESSVPMVVSLKWNSTLVVVSQLDRLARKLVPEPDGSCSQSGHGNNGQNRETHFDSVREILWVIDCGGFDSG